MAASGDPRPRALAGVARAAARRLLVNGPVGFARMSGSSIAAPSAAGWVTDFLNAAYYARLGGDRQVDDLRLARSILTTSWQQAGRRLRLGDLPRFHRAFGADRLRSGGRLDRAQLLAGAERLLWPGFGAAYADRGRNGWGVVFPDAEARAAYAPEQRLEHARLGELTPPRCPAGKQLWHTYAPVAAPSAAAVLAVLSDPSRWPGFGSDLGQFTSLRTGGLPGQTFEIEVVARLAPRAPVFTRAYVTATMVLERGEELDAYVRRLARDMATGIAVGGGARPLPAGAQPCALVALTTHEGHFMGNAVSRILLFEQDGRAYLRDIGSWDPMPPHLAVPYRLTGHEAQRAFWGEGTPAQSVLHQLAAHAGEQG